MERQRVSPVLAAGMTAGGFEVIESGADHEIRKASFQLGGLGRAFLRSRDILQLLFAQRQEEFAEQVPVANINVWVGACVSERMRHMNLVC